MADVTFTGEPSLRLAAGILRNKSAIRLRQGQHYFGQADAKCRRHTAASTAIN